MLAQVQVCIWNGAHLVVGGELEVGPRDLAHDVCVEDAWWRGAVVGLIVRGALCGDGGVLARLVRGGAWRGHQVPKRGGVGRKGVRGLIAGLGHGEIEMNSNGK